MQQLRLIIIIIGWGLICCTFAYSSISTNTVTLEAVTGKASTIGIPLNYPNPFNPEQESTYIAYRLSADATVSIFIYDITLAPVWRRTYPAGTEGGRSGYNEVAWNGTTNFGEMAENGIYYFRIVEETEGVKEVIGKGKIAVLR